MKNNEERIMVCLSREVKDDIVSSAKRFGVSASQYLILLHTVRESNQIDITKQLYK